MKLLLFDIDGTLLSTEGIGRQVLETALLPLLGRRLETGTVALAGRTDPLILSDLLRHNGFPDDEVRALLPEALAAYATAMQTELQQRHVRVLPGVEALLRDLADRPNVQLGLLTGNVEPVAYLKLLHAGLASYFPFGAFGNDGPDRPSLPAVAVARAEAHTGHCFQGKNVVIIGDTEHDITCGLGIGACSVAVCTGHYTRDDLTPHAPDLLFDDLQDAAAFLQHVVHANQPGRI